MSSTVRQLTGAENDIVESQIKIILAGLPEYTIKRAIVRAKDVLLDLISRGQARTATLSSVNANDIRIRAIVAENIDSESLISSYKWSWGTATATTALLLVNKNVPVDYGYVIVGLERMQPEDLLSIVQFKQGNTRQEVHDVTSWLNDENGRFLLPEPMSYKVGENINIKVYPHTTGTLIVKILGLEITLGTNANQPAL